MSTLLHTKFVAETNLTDRQLLQETERELGIFWIYEKDFEYQQHSKTSGNILYLH